MTRAYTLTHTHTILHHELSAAPRSVRTGASVHASAATGQAHQRQPKKPIRERRICASRGPKACYELCATSVLCTLYRHIYIYIYMFMLYEYARTHTNSVWVHYLAVFCRRPKMVRRLVRREGEGGCLGFRVLITFAGGLGLYGDRRAHVCVFRMIYD